MYCIFTYQFAVLNNKIRIIRKGRSMKIGGRTLDNMNFIISLNVIAAFCVLSGYKGVFNYIAFACVILSALTFLIMRRGRVRKDKAAVCFILYIVFYILTSLPFGDLRYLTTNTAYNILSFSPLFLFNALKRRGRRKNKINCARLMYFCWIIIGIITIIYYIHNPEAARNAAAHLDSPDGAMFGGYFYAFGSAILCVYLFTVYIKTDSFRHRKILPLICLILIYAVYLTQSTITTVSMCAGLVTAVLFRFKRKTKNQGLRLFMRLSTIAIVVYVIYYVVKCNIYPILNWLSRHDESLLAYRISEVLSGFFLSLYTHHFQRRVNLVLDSFKLFLQSPLIGHSYKYGNIFAFGKLFGIGNHSELSDTLARYGLVGGIPLYGCYFYGMKDYLKKYPGVAVTFAMMFTVNPFTSYQSHLAIFLLIPLVDELIFGEKRRCTK